MKKSLCAFLICLILIMSALGTVGAVYAAEVDVDRKSSLTICYKYESAPMEGLDVSIWRVASVSSKGEFELDGVFAGYPIDISNVKSQQTWRNIATTLSAYIIADKVDPLATAKTDGEGNAKFEDLKPGLYFIMHISTQSGDVRINYEDFLSAIPYPDYDGSYLYDITAYPKYTSSVPHGTDMDFKLVKLWKDVGHTKERPVSIDVDIYKDKVLFKTFTLNAENNWSFTWTAKDNGSVWTAVEKTESGKYDVTFVSEGNTLILVNTYDDDITPPPTGDTDVLWPWALLMVVSGSVLILCAVIGSKNRHEA